jgi:hypothetical protein
MADSFESAMVAEVTDLFRALIPDIGDEYRALDYDEPSMQVTIATTDGSSWVYQTGDNSYSGACYFHPYWGVAYLTRDCDPAEAARVAVAEAFEQLEQSS